MEDINMTGSASATSSLTSAPYPVCCTQCKRAAESSALDQQGEVICGACRSEMQVTSFPALYLPPVIKKSADLTLDVEASCFYHDERAAVLHCESCGRFLCSLCDIEFGPHHLCSSCIEAGRVTPEAGGEERVQRTLRQDEIAVTLGFFSIILPYIGMPLGVISILMSIVYWKRKCSLVQRSKWRFVTAILLSLFGLGLWGIAIIAVLKDLEVI